MSEDERRTLTVRVDERTFEQIQFLAQKTQISAAEMAAKLLADEAEAQVDLECGPFLRKYMYRA